MKDFLPGRDAFGLTIFVLFAIADCALTFTQSWWQAQNEGPAGVLVIVGLGVGLLYARWRFGRPEAWRRFGSTSNRKRGGGGEA